MIPSPGESPGAWWANTGQTTARRRQDEREGRAPDAAFDVMTIFMHDVPPDIVAEVFARGEPRSPTPRSPSPGHWSNGRAFPTRVLAGRYDRLFPLEFMCRLARERLGIGADVIDTGHLPALSRPDELVHRLEAYRLQHVPPAP
jgi:pimeloyl-ACP methyl ester carboxylesterase